MKRKLARQRYGRNLHVGSLAVVTEAPARLLLWRNNAGEWDWNNPTMFGTGGKLLDQRWVTSVAFSQDGSMICTGLFPGSIFALWDADSLQCWRVLAAPGSEARVCAFSPAGDVLATGGELSEIKLHELRPQGLLAAFDVRERDQC